MDIVPSWPYYFMSIAEVVKTRSKDPFTKVGAILINSDKHIIGTGYNGFKPGAVETVELWQRPTKYEHVIHAEENAIKNCVLSTNKAILFCTLYPCKECAKKIVDAGITSVYYKEHERNGRSYLDPISRQLFYTADINIYKVD